MKVCEDCGIEIYTKDGVNACEKCDQQENRKARQKRAARLRRERESLLRDLGLVRVKGNLGGTYWE